VTIVVPVVLLIAIVGGLWLLDRRAEQRLVAFCPVIEKASKDGASAIAAEIDDRLGKLVAGETETRKILASASARLVGIETSVGLVPSAINSLRVLLDERFKEWEERQVPPEGQEIATASLSRIQNVRAQNVALEEASLKALTDSIANTRGFREPIVRVRGGD
jgi:hypothetical protein